MSIEYMNRRGDRYYILQGKTKTGKPKYYCSKKPGGVPVERLPEGFEIHEAPESALVSVRKVRPTRITALERERLIQWAAELNAANPMLVEIDGDSLVVYASDVNSAVAVEMLEEFMGPIGSFRSASRSDWLVKRAHYSPAFRFSLVDEDEREYTVARWCDLDDSDNWLNLLEFGDLESLARRYLPHAGEESFFELM